MVTQGGLVNCLQWMQQRYELTEQDGFLLHTSLNFDLSVVGSVLAAAGGRASGGGDRATEMLDSCTLQATSTGADQ